MAQLPHFYHNADFVLGVSCTLNEESAKHIVQVLRMRAGDKLVLCNGLGDKAVGQIDQSSKKHCSVLIESLEHIDANKYRLHLAVAFTKNTSRNEWVLEKACELGVQSIIPIVADRSERIQFKAERWNNILVSAMLQSQQVYLPILHQPLKLDQILKQWASLPLKIIAHCEEHFMRTPIDQIVQQTQESIALIGPEGDFSPEEITQAYASGFKGVSLCPQRLRTETAALAICSFFNLRSK